MTYQTRRKLFITLTIVFFVSVPLLVLFTQGYRVDFDNKQLVKTGGLDLGIKNSDTSVFLNGELQRETGFLFRGAVFRNILPGEYDVEIQKENYNSWRKTVLVDKEQVAKFPVIKLFPKEFTRNQIFKGVDLAFLSPNQWHVFAQMQNSDTSIFAIDLGNLNNQPILEIPQFKNIRNVYWNNESSLFSIVLSSAIYIGSIDDLENLKNWTSFLSVNAPTAFNISSKIIPVSTNSVFVVETNANTTLDVHFLDIDKNTVRKNLVASVMAVEIIEDEIFYLDSDGLFNKLSLNDEQHTELTATAIARPTATGTIIKLRGDAKTAMIIDRKNLFLWQENKPLEKIASNVENAFWGREKLVYWNSQNVYVYWLEKIFGPPARLPGDIEHVTEFSSIENVFWASREEAYLLIKTPDSISLVEVDSRDRRTSVEYAAQNIQSFIGNNLNKESVYVIVNNNLIELNYQ